VPVIFFQKYDNLCALGYENRHFYAPPKSLNSVTGVYYTATGRVLSLARSDFQKIEFLGYGLAGGLWGSGGDLIVV